MRIFLDFDGTVVEYKKRFYHAYETVAVRMEKTPFSEEQFWEKRSEGKSMTEILGVKKTKWVDIFTQELERKENLMHDRLLCERRTLQELSSLGELILLSSRASKENLLWQLRRLRILSFFTDIQVSNDSTGEKSKILEKLGAGPGDILIGDTETDIDAGKEHGLMTFAVTSGLRTKNQMVSCKPDMIGHLEDLVKALKKKLNTHSQGDCS